MANQVVQVPVDSTGKKIDTEELTVGGNTVERQRIEITGSADVEIARVENSAPGATDYGLVTRNIPSGTQPVSGTVTANLGTVGGVALDATLSTTNTDLGGLTETAPATDTASSGLNGRLQRIAQRLTSLIALVPAALTGSGNFKVALVESTASQAVTGTVSVSGTVATSVADGSNVTIGTTTDAEASAGNGTVIAILKRIRTLLGGTLTTSATQSGTWTVQPGNTANTTAWKVDGSAVTQPVSGTVTANAGSGTFTTKETRPATGTASRPSPTTTSNGTILASNASRLGATIWNEGASELYVKFGATASVTSYAARIPSGGYYEVPFGYTGIVDAICLTGTAQAQITELT